MYYTLALNFSNHYNNYVLSKLYSSVKANKNTTVWLTGKQIGLVIRTTWHPLLISWETIPLIFKHLLIPWWIWDWLNILNCCHQNQTLMNKYKSNVLINVHLLMFYSQFYCSLCIKQLLQQASFTSFFFGRLTTCPPVAHTGYQSLWKCLTVWEILAGYVMVYGLTSFLMTAPTRSQRSRNTAWWEYEIASQTST